MREKCANVQAAAADGLNEPGLHLFAVYEQHDQSPVLSWLPILLGLFAVAIAALAFCPIPRSQTLSLGRALFLAVAYVVVTVGISVCVLATCGIVLGRRHDFVRLSGQAVFQGASPGDPQFGIGCG